MLKFYKLLFLIILTMATSQSKNNRILTSHLFNYPISDEHIGRDWSLSDSICFENLQESDNKVTVKSLWNRDSLYFLFKVTDKDLRAHQLKKDDPNLFLDDMVEILIDPEENKNDCWSTDDIVYHINLLSQKKDDRGTEKCLSDPSWDGTANFYVQLFGTLNDTTDIDFGYTVEIAFPWTELGVLPNIGSSIGINFANGDNDGKGRQLFNWSGAQPMRLPSAFGSLILTGYLLTKQQR